MNLNGQVLEKETSLEREYLDNDFAMKFRGGKPLELSIGAGHHFPDLMKTVLGGPRQKEPGTFSFAKSALGRDTVAALFKTQPRKGRAGKWKEGLVFCYKMS